MNDEPTKRDGGASEPRRSGFYLSALRWIIRAWAIYIGGGVLLALVVMITVSAILNLLTGRPLQGDYELTKHFMAIVIAAFLPYSQLSGANITVDIFTEGASDRAKAWMATIASLLALIFSVVLLRQTTLGMLEQMRRVETTTILHVPLWTAYPPMLVALALWVVASAITLFEAFRAARAPAPAAAT